MKIYLTLKYNTDGKNIWADVQAFTSKSERDNAFAQYTADVDAETQDVEVTKRAYSKQEAVTTVPF